MTLAIVWFRRDLRLQDNPALDAALRAHARVLCVYIHAPTEEAPWTPGAASRWWLHHSLAALTEDMRGCGAQLHIRAGPTLTALETLTRESGARAVYWNRQYEPALTARDTRITQVLTERGIQTHSFNANLLIEPLDIQTNQGGPYKVFTPFWRTLRAQFEPRPPSPAPKRIPSVAGIDSIALDALQLLPRIAWDRGLREHWRPGERGAHALLRRFAGAVTRYEQGRDRPDQDNTSRLSPHLHFGEIGPRQIVWKLDEHARGQRSEHARAAAEPFIRELGWREFSQHLLHHFPRCH